MTQPTPTPGAPANPPTPTPPAVAPPAPNPAPATVPAAPAPFDPSTLSVEAQEYLRQQIAANDLKARTGSKANAAAEARQELAKEVAKALGLATDEPPDPAVLATQVEEARDAAWRSGVELAVYRAAAGLGADPARLLDSMTFINSLDDLVDADPRGSDFGTALNAKITAAVAANPSLAGQAPATATPGQAPGPRPDPSQGARGTAPSGRPTSLGAAFGAHYAAVNR